MLGESKEFVRQRLQTEGRIPDDLHEWLKTALMPEGERIAELQLREQEADTLIKEQKLREIKFKNERTEGKYGLVEDFQRALDGILIRLQTNLYATPDQSVDAVMTSRDRIEGKEIWLESLERHMKEASSWKIDLPTGAQE